MLAAIQVPTTDAPPLADTEGRYELKGSRPIQPSEIWDDGSKTYLNWPQGTETPAIFALDSSGQETMVNSFTRGDHYVIDAVHTRLVFRLDRLTARAERKAPGK